MKLEIETDGSGDGTRIIINGVEQDDLTFFEFSVNTERSNKAALEMMKRVKGKWIPLRFYGPGIEEFDKASELDKKENVNVIGNKKSRQK